MFGMTSGGFAFHTPATHVSRRRIQAPQRARHASLTAASAKITHKQQRTPPHGPRSMPTNSQQPIPERTPTPSRHPPTGPTTPPTQARPAAHPTHPHHTDSCTIRAKQRADGDDWRGDPDNQLPMAAATGTLARGAVVLR